MFILLSAGGVSHWNTDSILYQIRQKVPKEMVFTKDHIHLSNIVGQGIEIVGVDNIVILCAI